MAILDAARRELEELHEFGPTIDHRLLAEAVSHLLDRAGNRLTTVDLLTMIGLADHILMRGAGTPLSGDDYLALPNGPVPIRLFLELSELARNAQDWSKRIRVEGSEVVLVDRGSTRTLSRGQIKALEAAFEAVNGKPTNEVIDRMNEACPEWFPNIGKVVPLATVFTAFGASQRDADEWVKELRSSYRRADGMVA